MILTVNRWCAVKELDVAARKVTTFCCAREEFTVLTMRVQPGCDECAKAIEIARNEP